jgi:autoinducer 2-degrading protein
VFAVIVSLRVKPWMTAEFLRAMTANAAASLRDEPGCVRFDILRDNADPGRFVLYELYTDEDAFRSKHLAASHFAQWRAAAPAIVEADSQVDDFFTLQNPSWSGHDAAPPTEST